MSRVRLAALLGLAMASCIKPAAFPCERDDQCNASGTGVCAMPEGYCAYEDGDCASGLRFESRAPTVGGRCVEEDTSTSESTGDGACGGPLEPCCDEACDGSLVCLSAGCGCGFVTLSGSSHSCHVHADGATECWGSNVNGELGRSTEGEIDATPGFVDGIPAPLSVFDVDGRDHTCIVTSGGRVYCWGDNRSGQANLDSPASRIDAAQLVIDAETFGDWAPTTVATGSEHTCVGGDGNVFCWGGDNAVGQLGWPDEEPVPVDTSGWRGELEGLEAGGAHSCAHTIEDDGGHHVYCWGWDELGQLGNGDGDQTGATPDEVVLEDGVEVFELSASDFHTCAIVGSSAERSVVCWGDNQFGQSVADGSDMATVPTPVQGLPAGPWLSVSAGPSSSCATSETDGLWCWGNNGFGKVLPGGPDETLPPTEVPLLELGTAALFPSVGAVHVCATAVDGTVVCWGCGGQGQLGPDAPLTCTGESGDYWLVVPTCG